MINLTQEEREKVLNKVLENKYITNRIKIGDTFYYVKLANYYDDGMELVVKNIADDLEIDCAEYDAIMVCGQLLYFSKSLENDSTFITGKQLFISRVSHSISKIGEVFASLYPFDQDKLFSDLVRIYLLDIFLMNEDRHLGNWGIRRRNCNINLSIIDNAYAFLNRTQTYLRAKDNTYYEIIYKKDNDPEDYIVKLNIDDLEWFINNFDKKYISMLLDMFYKLTPEYIAGIFLDVTKKLNKSYFRYSQKFLRLYDINYQAIKDLLKKYHLIDDIERIKEK